MKTVNQLRAHPRTARAGKAAAVVVVGIAGAALGLLLAGGQRADAGPFTVELSLRPNGHGESVIEVPPLGNLTLDTHAGPLTLDVQVVELREQAARQLVDDPASLDKLGGEVKGDLRGALLKLVLRSVLVCVVGASALGFLVFRTRKDTLWAGAASFSVLVATAGLGVVSFDKESINEPKYTGLLASAPTAVGSVRDVVDRVDQYSRSLGRLVGNVTQLYDAASGLSTFTPADDTIRVLSVSDLHLSPSAYDVISPVVAQFGIDVVVDTGDSTDFGSTAEASYVSQISALKVPYVWVRGNHDSAITQAAVARQRNATVLDGDQVVTVAGLRFLGRGDPRFTPDKTTGDDADDKGVEQETGGLLREAAADGEPDIIAVHEPEAARELFGSAPLVLTGHTHKRAAETRNGTLLLTQGSTGGAGARGLEGEAPTPIAMSVLYLDPTTKQVLARDDITLGGLGLSSAQIERTVAKPAASPPR